ncbi:MAG: ABC transporter substrate-binding protein [bacterium]
MKKFLSMLVPVLLATTLLVGCSNSDDGGGDSSSNSSSAETFLIGGSGPLTGDYAQYGIAVKQGAQIAIDEINAIGGVNGMLLEVKIEDDQADPANSPSAYATLYDSGMKVSLGGVTSGACLSAVAEAEKDGILVVTPTATLLEIVEPANVFRVCFNDPSQGTYAADFISKNNIASEVAILYDKSSDYSVGVTETFVDQAKDLGLDILTQQAFTSQSNVDFSVQLEAVKASGAELLFLPIYYNEAALILTQADQIGLDVIFFGCDGVDGILQAIGESNVHLTENLMLLTPFAADSSEPIVANFTASYQNSYNLTPDQFAADGYDAIYIIKEAIETAGITDMNDDDLDSKLIEAMTQIEVKGTTGTMTWSEDGEPIKDATAVIIKDGVYVAFDN